MRHSGFVLVLSVAIALGMASTAFAVGPGGWDHLGDAGTPSSD